MGQTAQLGGGGAWMGSHASRGTQLKADETKARSRREDALAAFPTLLIFIFLLDRRDVFFFSNKETNKKNTVSQFFLCTRSSISSSKYSSRSKSTPSTKSFYFFLFFLSVNCHLPSQNKQTNQSSTWFCSNSGTFSTSASPSAGGERRFVFAVAFVDRSGGRKGARTLLGAR